MKTSYEPQAPAFILIQIRKINQQIETAAKLKMNNTVSRKFAQRRFLENQLLSMVGEKEFNELLKEEKQLQSFAKSCGLNFYGIKKEEESVNMKEIIKDRHIAQGDLVFINHITKPTKTGWWRKLRIGEAKNNVVMYVLEKPMHKDYNFETELINCHTENGLCVMAPKTLTEGIDGYKPKYEILAYVRGYDAVNLVKENYDLGSKIFTCLFEDEQNVIVTKKFLELRKHYAAKEERCSEMESLAKLLK